MDLGRDQLIEIAVASSTVFLMIGMIYWVGNSYSVENGISAEGGQVLVGVIVGFILLLTAIGIGLAYALNDPEDGLEDESDTEAETETQNLI